jgi:hypothetical protein
MVRRIAIAVVVVLVAASCAHLRGGGPGNEGLVITVGVPGAGGDRVVDVVAPRPPADHAISASVYLGKPFGAPIASGVLPLRFTLSGAQATPGIHPLIAVSRDGSALRFGAVFFNGDLRLNQVQVLGTHNSYHVAPPPPYAAVEAWQYSHDPLPVQFQSEGIRQIELDVYADPHGIRVLHVPDVDFGTTCSLWVECLRVVKGWSDAHPNHMPITILTELVDTSYGLPTPVLPWNGPAMDQLDAEIRSVFPPRDVITPDDVRGRRATLAEAITKDGWPTINSVRGQVMFVMDNGGSYRDTYTNGHPTLENRMIFTNSDFGRADAAFLKLNNPINDAPKIQQAVAGGYVTRTRADADTVEARANNTAPRDAAINGGAQWVSTDYEVPGRAYGQPYFVKIPGGTPARCNPINSPPWCTSGQIESLTP